MSEWLDTNTIPVPETGCLLWSGTWSRGYGVIGRRVNGKSSNLRAHRESYERHVGRIPNGMVVRHKCDTPACCNPAHLAIGTDADNVKDMHVRGRANYTMQARGEAASGAVLTESEVLEIYVSPLSTRVLGRMYGVTNGAVHAIKQGRAWSHLTGEKNRAKRRSNHHQPEEAAAPVAAGEADQPEGQAEEVR